MPHRLARALLIATLTAFASLPHGAAVGPAFGQAAKTSVIEAELFEVQSLARLQDMWRLALRQPGDMLADLKSQSPTTNIDQAWSRAVDKTFGTATFATSLARFQASQLTEPEAREIIAFRKTELGRKLTEAEVTSPFPADKTSDNNFQMAEITKMARALDANKPRKQLVNDLLKAAGGNAVQVELLMALARGIAIGMTATTQPGRPRATDPEIGQNLDKQRPQLEKLMGAIAVPSLALSYRSLTDAQLRAYLTHLRSPLGRKNIAAVIKAYAAALSTASSEIGREFGKDINAQRL